MKEKRKVIGVYVKEEVIETIGWLAKHFDKTRNGLVSEMLEFAADVYEQDFVLSRKVRDEFDQVKV
jgi:hypothetical protein